MTTPMYFTHGTVIAESGNVKVYELAGEHYLEIGPGHTLWAINNELKEYAEQIEDKAKGNCLEVGLGLGVSSNYILSRAGVKSLTTIEVNENVLEVYRQLNPRIPDKHKMIHGSGQDFLLQTNEKFDFIFLDMYSCIDEETLLDIELYVKLSKRILKLGGEIVGWQDIYTPEEFITEFYKIFKEARDNE